MTNDGKDIERKALWTILLAPWRLRLREFVLGGANGADGPVRRILRFARTLKASYREAIAVAAGQRRYFPVETDDTALRRNIHRLEKGLVSRPRRHVFALDYIGSTVTRFERAVNDRQNDPDTLDESAGHEMCWTITSMRCRTTSLR